MANTMNSAPGPTRQVKSEPKLHEGRSSDCSRRMLPTDCSRGEARADPSTGPEALQSGVRRDVDGAGRRWCAGNLGKAEEKSILALAARDGKLGQARQPLTGY
jgi:hypothetical protein